MDVVLVLKSQVESPDVDSADRKVDVGTNRVKAITTVECFFLNIYFFLIMLWQIDDRCYECGDRGHYARDCRKHGRSRRR